MSLHRNFLLVLLTWLSYEVELKKLTKNAQYNAASSDELQHAAGDPNFDAQYPGGLAKQLKKNAKSKGLRTHRDDLDEQTTLELSLACNDVATKLFLSERPQNTGRLSPLNSRIYITGCSGVLWPCCYRGPEERNCRSQRLRRHTLGGQCSTTMKYETTDGQLADVTLPCTARPHPSYSNDGDLSDGLIHSLQSDNPNAPHKFKCNIPPSHNGPRCSLEPDQRIKCGSTGIPAPACQHRGCCYNHADHSCSYPINECTADKHFVFVVQRQIGNFTVDLAKLITSGNPGCPPKIITRSYAVFFFPTNACGVHAYKIGETQVFSVEVLTSLSPIPAISANISRDLQFRLMVECRYAKSPLPDLTNLVSAGFMVKSPSVYPMVQSEGLFSVQLEIAEDGNYRKFYPSYHLPLHVLLGHSVFLQVGIKAANPKVALLVNYCIAYPRLATKALVLLHDGCPNPLDQGGVFLIRLPGTKHLRRFEVKAFQFMEAPAEYLDEPIYFLCSTELCFGGKCEEGCFARP